MARTFLLQSLTILALATTVLCRQKCFSCAFNNHVTQKRGIECVSSPRNASADWAVRCDQPTCYYTTTVDAVNKQLLSINRGCGYLGETSCRIVGPREECIFTCSSDFCNGGLSGLLVETQYPNGARRPVKYITHLTSSAMAFLVVVLLTSPSVTSVI